MPLEDKFIEIKKKPEKAITVAVFQKGADREKAHELFNELELLADTAGANVIETFHQELRRPIGATYIGKGKLAEIKDFIQENDVKLAIFDDELTPVQIRNIEKELEIKILDRSGLILDIFAQRAQTREAKTQVELAQMQYLMPRLTRMWTHLSKQYGGIGTRGPGETQIEVDRRLIRARIEKLKDKLKLIDTQSDQKRKSRDKVLTFALVGYTNAGKSTLMRAITESEVYIEDKLFATLDTTTRKFNLPNGQDAILSDTVGFIRKLPSHLVASFRSTLAEVRESDFIIHVVDISHKYFDEHIKTVEKTLAKLNIVDKPILQVFNKIDLLDEIEMVKVYEDKYPNSIFVSAHKNMNINALLNKFQDLYDRSSNNFDIFLPYEHAELVQKLYLLTDIISQTDNDYGSYYKLKVQDEKLFHFKNIFEDYIVVYE